MRFEKWHEKCLKNTISEDMPELDIPDDLKHIVQTELTQSMHRAYTHSWVSMEQSIPTWKQTIVSSRVKKKKTPDT